jgi:hypothetical protein
MTATRMMSGRTPDKSSWKYESDFAFGKAPASVVPAPDVRDADAGKSRG